MGQGEVELRYLHVLTYVQFYKLVNNEVNIEQYILITMSYMNDEIEIQEQINRNQSDDFQFSLSEEQMSFQIKNSLVQFNKENVVIGKDGPYYISHPQTHIQHPKFDREYIDLSEKEKIGSGSAGVVYVAPYEKEGQFSELVAIKQIQVHNKKSRQQFLKELQAGINNQGENNFIVKFYGCFYEHPCIYEVFEYMDSGSLRDMIDHHIEEQKFLHEFQLAEICQNILKALGYIHQIKQIHRDIKPENILLNSKGEIKIADFGIFKQLENQVLQTSTYCGTAAYMSPELAKDHHSFKTDIWSFGLVLYELTTNLPNPYKKKYEQFGECIYLDKLSKDCPPKIPVEMNRSGELSDFLKSCLQKDPEKRADEHQLLNHVWLKRNVGNVSLKEVFSKMANRNK